MIAKIAVSAAAFAIDKPYSYVVPEGMELRSGMRVQVPFGRGNKSAQGIVLSVEEGSADGLKAISVCLDKEPLLSSMMLRLGAFMRERYFCTYFDAVKAMLPAGLWFQTNQSYRLTEDLSWKDKKLRVQMATEILQFLSDCGGETDDKNLRALSDDQETLDKAIRYLISKKWIYTKEAFRPRTNDKTETIATLAAPAEEVMEYAAARPKSAAMQRAVLELMCSVGSAAVKEICYFTGANPTTVRRLAELGYLELSQRPVLRCRQIEPAKVEKELTLNEEQDIAYIGLCKQMTADTPGSALLYGITGSGKTAVYIQLIRHALEQDKQVMLLVPEIALTPQLLGLMAGYFGDNVAVLHSSLPETERYDQWKRIHNGDARVIVGTRSAVFAPCKNLGLIILDEEQEHSYKSENAPRYDAREIALWRGIKEKALVLFGSATPSVETMYRAKAGRHSLYTLSHRYNGKELPRVEIVDMHEDVRQGNDMAISYALQDAIGKTTEAGKQTILFLNRRGNSRALVCVDCNRTPECPRCNASLTYHSANGRLMCHYCGHSQKANDRCPECGGPLKPIGTGTQKVQQQLEMLFPGMEVARMDTDTVNAANTHQQILDKFRDEKIPVLVGTQMVAKGLNLPDVTLVGVLDADLSLYTGSYRAAETTFNMLTQVVGRAGRGDTDGTAMIQTVAPDHPVIRLAAKQDYDSFYDLELEMRRIQKNPPFGDLATVIFTGENEGKLIRGAQKFRDSLISCLSLPEYEKENCTVLGPAPCVVPKINYNFRYRLTLRLTMTKSMRLLLAHLLRQFASDRENREITAFIDINGYD